MATFSFESRINPIAVIAGVFFTLAMMFLFMSWAAALGVWNHRVEDLAGLEPRVWKLASEVWTVSVLCGSILSVQATRITDLRSAFLNSLSTWAGSFIFFGGLSHTIAQVTFLPLLPTQELFRTGALGDIGSFFAAILGGFLSFLFEKVRLKASESRDFQRFSLSETS